MRLDEVLSNYQTRIRADGRTEHTGGQYRRHIPLLATWLAVRHHGGTVGEICHENLAAFLASPVARTRPDGRGKKATSTSAMRTTLRTFFRYAHEAGYTRSNPARLIRRALCGSPPPRALADEEQGNLLLALSKGTDPDARRDHALFALMLCSGIRIVSALALEVGDVDVERGELQLRRTKGDCPVSVPAWAHDPRSPAELRGRSDCRSALPRARWRGNQREARPASAGAVDQARGDRTAHSMSPVDLEQDGARAVRQGRLRNVLAS